MTDGERQLPSHRFIGGITSRPDGARAMTVPRPVRGWMSKCGAHGLRGGSMVSRLAAVLVTVLLLSVACGEAAAPGQTPARTDVVLATGFRPSMNSAPYYLARARGYYADEGLNVDIKDGVNPALLQQAGQGKVDFAVTTGDALVPARAAGIPVVMVMQQLTQSPVGAIALTSGDVSLASPANLRGRRVGVSAPDGSTYFGLLALLAAAHLSLSDVDVVSIGFTELEALAQKRVSVAMTYLNNEPVQAGAQGIQVKSLEVSRFMPLVSTGLATSQQNVKNHPDLVRRFVKATLRGLRDTLDHPDAASKATLARMPETTADGAALQRQVLQATLKFEQPVSGHPLGWGDPAAWRTTTRFLASANVVKTNVDPGGCYTNSFVGS
jgi:NitT/TauT family transport system substrate-binding protein